jgi:hypothetical protein
VQRHTPNLDGQHQKVREANVLLAQYERLSRIALVLVLVLNVVLLALVLSDLWGHPWMQESIRSLVP